MDNYIILIPIVIALIIIIIVIASLIKKSNKTKEESASILDVNEVGVPSNAEFSYGYEKEATVVMNPVDIQKEENNNSEEVKEESEDK